MNRPFLFVPRNDILYEQIGHTVQIAPVSVLRCADGASHGEEGTKPRRAVLGLYKIPQVSRYAECQG